GEGERAAEREDALADLEPGGIAEARHRKRPRARGTQLQDGDVRQRVGADEVRGHLLARRERTRDRFRAAGDMMIRQDVTFGPDEGAAPRRLAFDLAALLVLDRDDVNANETGGDV